MRFFACQALAGVAFLWHPALATTTIPHDRVTDLEVNLTASVKRVPGGMRMEVKVTGEGAEPEVLELLQRVVGVCSRPGRSRGFMGLLGLQQLCDTVMSKFNEVKVNTVTAVPAPSDKAVQAPKRRMGTFETAVLLALAGWISYVTGLGSLWSQAAWCLFALYLFGSALGRLWQTSPDTAGQIAMVTLKLQSVPQPLWNRFGEQIDRVRQARMLEQARAQMLDALPGLQDLLLELRSVLLQELEEIRTEMQLHQQALPKRAQAVLASLQGNPSLAAALAQRARIALVDPRIAHPPPPPRTPLLDFLAYFLLPFLVLGAWVSLPYNVWLDRQSRAFPRRPTSPAAIRAALEAAEANGVICSITLEPITVLTGVMTPCGHFYNRRALECWLRMREHPQCPSCLEPCEVEDL